MKRIILVVSVSMLSMVFFACTDEPGDPAPPAVGNQIDRNGRPGISTALIAPFEADSDAKANAKNGYNGGSNGDTTYVPEIMANLAIIDSLNVDGSGTSVCGDQVLADADSTRYAVLASVLNDDRLWINSGPEQNCATEGQAFLAVEAGTTGLIPAAAGLCGGRLPSQDVIATVYSALISDLSTPYDDGITEDPDGVADDDTFPYLTAPN